MLAAKFRLRGFRRLSDAVVQSLGDLERSAMTQVRRHGEANVSKICEALGGGYAYTTIMTTLDRLFKKGLLDRRKDGRAFIYTARYSAEEMERGVAEDVIGSLLDTGTGPIQPVLACIVDAVSDRDRQFLDELERLVQEKRRELDSERS